MGRHVRRGSSKAGRIPLPPVEIVELDDRLDGAAIGKPTRLSPETGWFTRLFRTDRASRYILEPQQIPADVLQDRRDFALLEFEDGRPVLQVLPGMAGELRIGVSRMTVAQMLADPALRRDDGRARLPLPNGARVRISCGTKTYLARIGGPPLILTLQPAAGQAQLVHA
ncbi:MAG TPA: hypothetical protein VK034_29190 [Enhygromyxa sp.]|nr:hypothetical protein [Enhygromyxa sp.]